MAWHERKKINKNGRQQQFSMGKKSSRNFSTFKIECWKGIYLGRSIWWLECTVIYEHELRFCAKKKKKKKIQNHFILAKHVLSLSLHKITMYAHAQCSNVHTSYVLRMQFGKFGWKKKRKKNNRNHLRFRTISIHIIH